jgi:tetratricopeptide (TPR) repeat protein
VIAATVMMLGVPLSSRADVVVPLTKTPAETLFDAGIQALERNDLAAAETAFTRSLELDAKAAAPYMGLAQVALRRNQREAAEKHMRRAAALAPYVASIQTSFGAFLHSQGELPEAEQALRKAVALDDTSVVARIRLGDLYLTAFRKIDEAIVEYRAALAIAPGHAGAHYALGVALAAKNDPTAEAELKRAGELAPGNPLPTHALGRWYFSRGKLDPALDAFARASKILPSFGQPHIERGNIFAFRGDDERALIEYGEAQRRDPGRGTGHLNIGMVHQRHQRWAQAEAAYLAALKVEPANAVALNNLAWMAADRKVKLDQALAWANKAVSLQPDVPEYQGTLGWVYRARGDMARAERVLQKAANLEPARAAVVYTLARLYLEQGLKAQAAAEITRALAMDGTFPGSNEARAKLKELTRS